MITWVDHLLVALLAVLFPVWAGVFGSRRLKRATPAEIPRLRLATYRRAMLLLWGLSVAVAALWIVHGRSWLGLGMVPRPTPGLLGVALGAAIVIYIMIRERNVGSSRVDLQACKLEYSIVSPK